MEEKIIKLDRKTICDLNKGKIKAIRCCCCGAKIGLVRTQKIDGGAIRHIVEINDEEDSTNDISKQSLVVLIALFKKFKSIGICVPCKHKIFEKYPDYSDDTIHIRFDHVMRYIEEKQPNDVKKKSKLRLKACKQFEKELSDKARNN